MSEYDSTPGNAYNWHECDTGSFITSDGGETAVIFERRDGRWGIVANDVFAKGSYDTAHAAAVAYETDDVAWDTPQGWAMNKKGTGWWRKDRCAGILSVKQAKSGSWFWLRAGDEPHGWFPDRRSAQSAADHYAAQLDIGRY